MSITSSSPLGRLSEIGENAKLLEQNSQRYETATSLFCVDKSCFCLASEITIAKDSTRKSYSIYK